MHTLRGLVPRLFSLISKTDCSFKIKNYYTYLKSAICWILEEAASRNNTQKENMCLNQFLQAVQWWCAQSQQQPSINIYGFDIVHRVKYILHTWPRICFARKFFFRMQFWELFILVLVLRHQIINKSYCLQTMYDKKSQ